MLRQQPQLCVTLAWTRLMVTRATHDAFASLVGVDLKTFFYRTCIMGSPPRFLRGACKVAMRFAVEVELGVDAHNEQRICQGWKLFLLLPRMVLHKPARGWLVPKKKLLERFSPHSPEESGLLSADCGQLVQWGELSSARSTLEGAPVALGNDATIRSLQDPPQTASIAPSM